MSNIFANTFSSLSHKNFRNFWWGQGISTIGGMIQVTALSWYVYKISGSPFLLGLMGVFEFGPVLVLSLFVGVLIERFPKKKILLFTQSLFLVQSLLLALLIWQGVTNYWYFAILAIVAGIASSIEQPTRQSYFVELVGKEDLPNAISLNSTTFNLARIIGPVIAGLIMKYVGIAECFLINGLSFIPVIIGIASISISGVPRKRDEETRILTAVKQGLKYMVHNNKLLPTFLIMAIVCTFSMNSNVILPVFAKDVLAGNEGTYSVLMSALGIGSLAGALFMANIGRKIRNKYFLIMVALCMGLFQIMTIIPIHSVVYIAILLVLIGFMTLCFLNRANTRIQLNTDDNYRGRVMSIYVLIGTGSTPIGNALSGWVMDTFGENYGYFSNGLTSVVLVLVIFYIYKQYYVKAKVVPDNNNSKLEQLPHHAAEHTKP